MQESAPETFNLIRDPWLPVRLVDGAHEARSIDQIFEGLDTIASIDTGLASTDAGAFDLLMAIMYRSVGHMRFTEGVAYQNEEDNTELSLDMLGDSGRIVKDAYANYIKTHIDAFELLDGSFMQTKGLTLVKDFGFTSLSALFSGWRYNQNDAPRSSDQNVWTQKNFERVHASDIALQILARNAFGRSVPAGVSEDSKTSVRSYTLGRNGLFSQFVLSGANLAETLALNFVPQSKELYESDIASWEFIAENGERAWNQVDYRCEEEVRGTADVLTYQNTAVDFQWDGPFATGFVAAVNNLRLDGEAVSVYSPYALIEKKKIPSKKTVAAESEALGNISESEVVVPEIEKFKYSTVNIAPKTLWANLETSILSPKQSSDRPSNMAWLEHLCIEEPKIRRKPLYGSYYTPNFSSNNTSYVNHRKESTPLFAAMSVTEIAEDGSEQTLELTKSIKLFRAKAVSLSSKVSALVESFVHKPKSMYFGHLSKNESVAIIDTINDEISQLMRVLILERFNDKDLSEPLSKLKMILVGAIDIVIYSIGHQNLLALNKSNVPAYQAIDSVIKVITERTTVKNSKQEVVDEEVVETVVGGALWNIRSKPGVRSKVARALGRKPIDAPDAVIHAFGGANEVPYDDEALIEVALFVSSLFATLEKPGRSVSGRDAVFAVAARKRAQSGSIQSAIDVAMKASSYIEIQGAIRRLITILVAFDGKIDFKRVARQLYTIKTDATRINEIRLEWAKEFVSLYATKKHQN